MRLPVELWDMVLEDPDLTLRDLHNLRLTCKSLAGLTMPERFVLTVSRFKKDRDRFEKVARSSSLSRHVRKIIWENLDLEAINPLKLHLLLAACDEDIFWAPLRYLGGQTTTSHWLVAGTKKMPNLRIILVRYMDETRKIHYKDEEISVAQYTSSRRSNPRFYDFDLPALSSVLCDPECQVRSFTILIGTGLLYATVPIDSFQHLTSIEIGLFCGFCEGHSYLISRLRRARNLKNLKLRILPQDERDVARETEIETNNRQVGYRIRKMCTATFLQELVDDIHWPHLRSFHLAGCHGDNCPPTEPSIRLKREVASLLSNNNNNNYSFNNNRNIARAINALCRQLKDLTLDECSVTCGVLDQLRKPYRKFPQLQSFNIQPRDHTGSWRIALPETKILAYLKNEIEDLQIETSHPRSRLYVYTE
ncbi:hypothetical protein F5B22DRAFT_662332 [Xylaria bambusicola]|uniref:uncharacterized protein n=1 Tax=Xylaria bambusicola TaxID=326684 RepID=UPI0020074FB1|nr:uncharacterized protein F5B22DRAFT_662332 [Xylaria bambusicola]KAI0521178.1 hypothetical protein F5B22DRAFT_662332 [Xylaria bambusicola]